MKELFVFAPDTRIKEHPIRFVIRIKEAVKGLFEENFTQAMPRVYRKFIHPKGKAFKMPLCTLGIREMKAPKRRLFGWDNQTFKNPIGLGKQSPKH